MENTHKLLCPKGIYSSTQEVQDFNQWLMGLPHRHKIVVAGNHDHCFERQPEQARALLTAAHYLEDEALVLEGFHFWGSPVTPTFFNLAFNQKRGDEIGQTWAQIPTNTEVLITHGPPMGILDRTFLGKHVGCEMLQARLEVLGQLRLHVFGHIHEAQGKRQKGSCTFANVAVLGALYRVVHQAQVFDL
jgi:Icc-related predicted phosphoesterase